MHVTYHIGIHDGGFAYRVGTVWSEPYPTHHDAVMAAKFAAMRQRIGGANAKIIYQGDDGVWRSEYVKGSERPETDVVDDTVISQFLRGMPL
ncbi:hypothetical protein QN224_13730 [Sinorhizobium sp. 8-89]|uniref:hypothetical protein n=1 Tax=Sinorhizobium sp. 7-81 TaxID=3049087 RepID=UPI0024C41ACC|nr:hypothetical protein [Sinorhizobium sp. 7-81]MDK1386466.1 hypothetical protein [Sinorhizobium sp. 7-81]